MATQHSVLVVDDDPEVTRFVCDLLTAHGYKVRGATSGDAATRFLKEETPDVVITDLRMGDVSGLDLIAYIKRFDPRIAVVAITAFGSIDTAIRAIKLGAFDYVTKPFTPEVLLLTTEKATRERQMRVELVRLREEIDRGNVGGLDGFIARSPAMQDIVALVKRAAPSPTNVLITGANGTGKETIARAIHALSPRKGKPFVVASCSTVPEALLDEELFGSDGGIFHRGEGGTVLLEGVSELSPALQVKLVRLLQLGESPAGKGGKATGVDVRLIASNDHDLHTDVEAKTFREDLYYRLRVIEVRLPPLRDRPQDITPLAQHFLARYADRVGKQIVGFNEPSLKQLTGYTWPGNVRELESVIERAATLCEHNVVRPEDLPDLIRTRSDTDFLAMAAAREMTLGELERAYMLRVLERTGGNKLRAAQILGIDRKTIYRWLGGQAEGAGVAPGDKPPVEPG